MWYSTASTVYSFLTVQNMHVVCDVTPIYLVPQMFLVVSNVRFYPTLRFTNAGHPGVIIANGAWYSGVVSAGGVTQSLTGIYGKSLNC